MAQVVGAELALEAVGGRLAGRGHDPCVVDQQVKPVGAQPVGELSHRGQVTQVELRDNDIGVRGCGTDVRRGRLPLFQVPDGHDHLCPGSRQLARRR